MLWLSAKMQCDGRRIESAHAEGRAESGKAGTDS